MKAIATILIAAFATGGLQAKPLAVAALHCGSLPSPDHQRKADLTLRHDGQRELRILTCDRQTAECSVAFAGSADVPTRIAWQSNTTLVVERQDGNYSAAQSLNDPRVSIRSVKDFDAAPSLPSISFDRARCGVNPPIEALR